MNSIIIKVDGMSCAHCVAAVKGAVAALPGVAEVAVSLEGGTAEVTYDPEKIAPADMAEAIEAQGYDIVM